MANMMALLCLLLPFFIFNHSVASLIAFPNTFPPNHQDWNKAVQKGKQLFQQLQSGSCPDKANPATAEDLIADKWSLGDWPPMTESLEVFSPSIAQMFRWTSGRDNYKVVATRTGVY